jgi:hypothetical protein
MVILASFADAPCHVQAAGSPDPSTNFVSLRAGQVLTRTLAGATGTTYHIAVPDHFNPARPPPLLVVFSPGGDGRGMMERVRSPANKVGWMVIGCDTLKNDMRDDEGLSIEKELIQEIRAFIPYDPARLYYGGFSGGGARAYHMTHHFREPCAGILALGAWLGGRTNQKSPFQRDMAVAMVNGDNDRGATAWEASDKNVLEEQRGCRVKVFHFPGGHAVAPRDVLDKAIDWLDKQAFASRPRSTAQGPEGPRP